MHDIRSLALSLESVTALQMVWKQIESITPSLARLPAFVWIQYQTRVNVVSDKNIHPIVSVMIV
jgi:hypothetical protein